MKLTVARRAVLKAGLSSAAANVLGCSPPTSPSALGIEPLPADVSVRRLTDLVTYAGVEWLVWLQPESLLASPVLKEPLARLFKDERLDALAQSTGLQLRHVPELVLASHRVRSGGSTTSFLLRHRSDSVILERKFRERLTSGSERRAFGHQLIGVWGLVGRTLRGFVSVGPTVVGYQYGGDRRHGPAKVALLYADGQLRDVPSVATAEELTRVEAMIAGAPVRAMLVGPFEGDTRRGARGLFESASVVAFALAPTPTTSFALRVVLAGEFAEARAPSLLLAAWDDIAKSDLGHLLSLSAPVRAPTARAADGYLLLEAELDATALLKGLAAATTDNVQDFLR